MVAAVASQLQLSILAVSLIACFARGCAPGPDDSSSLIQRRLDRADGHDLGGRAECKGIPSYNQTCLLHNAVYNGETGKFMVFALPGATVVEPMEVHMLGVPTAATAVQVVNVADRAEIEAQVPTSSIRYISNLSLVFAAWWHHNWAHGFFDGLYPAFVGLAKFGLEDELYTPLVALDETSCPGDASQEDLQIQHSACWVQDGFRLFGSKGNPDGELLSLDRITYKKQWLHFEKLVIGSGHQGEYTSSVELPGSRSFFRTSDLPQTKVSLLRSFANRMYQSHGLPKLDDRSNSKDGRNTTLKVRAIDVEHLSDSDRTAEKDAMNSYSLMEHETLMSSKATAASALHAAMTSFKSDPLFDAEVIHWEQLQPFRKQLELLRDVDIFVAGPGTGQFYSVFLPDGAVQVSLGARWPHDKLGVVPSFGEEMLTGSNTHIKALFMDLKKVARGYTAGDIEALVNNASSEIRQGFTIPISNQEDNLSVLGKIVLHLMRTSPQSKAGLDGFQVEDGGYACRQRLTGQSSPADVVFELNDGSGNALLDSCHIEIDALRKLKEQYRLNELLGINATCDCVVCPACGSITPSTTT